MASLVNPLRRSLRRVALQRCMRSYATASQDNRVKIIEVGPRDGLQNEKKSIPLATKIELIERLAKTGLQTIEAGSFVSPKWVPQVWSSSSSSKPRQCDNQLTYALYLRCNPPPK